MPPVRRKEEIDRPDAYGGSGRFPALRFRSYNRRDNDEVFHRNAIRLFARDFDFHNDAVWACLKRDITIVGPYDDVDINGKLERLKVELQREMLGSDDLNSRVFDHARKYEETHTDDTKLKDKPKEEREAVWATAFNDVVFWIMVDPLRQGINVDRFRAIEKWEEMYRAMFIAAADAMYMCRLGGPTPAHKVNMQKVYSAVRSVIDAKFSDRPKFDTIPSQGVGRWDRTHRKTRIKMQKFRGGSEWAGADFSATPKELGRRHRARYIAAARSGQLY